jgi:hypothetical protein
MVQLAPSRRSNVLSIVYCRGNFQVEISAPNVEMETYRTTKRGLWTEWSPMFSDGDAAYSDIENEDNTWFCNTGFIRFGPFVLGTI